VGRRASVVAIGACVLLPAWTEPAAHFRFADVAAARGIDRVMLAGRPDKDHLLDSAGSGAAFLDYDRDGRLDVYVVNGWRLDGSRIVERGKNALYRQRPDGNFEDVTDRAGVGGEGEWGAGVTVADYDNDGWPDILVTNFGRNVLYRNLGDGRFENVAARVGIEAPGWNTAAAFRRRRRRMAGPVRRPVHRLQPDDVLKARPSLSWRASSRWPSAPSASRAPDHFFRNERTLRRGHRGSGNEPRWASASRSARPTSMATATRRYVANDSDPNYPIATTGRATKEVAVRPFAFDGNGAAQASMGIAFGDADGDGVPDPFVTNFSEDFATLYKGVGGGFFSDVSRETGVGPLTRLPLKWGTALADFDNDGDLDLLVADGHIYPQIDRHPEVIGTYRQRNLLLENRLVREGVAPGGPAEPLFRDATGEAGPGFETKRAHRGLAVGDFDNDGRLDVLVTALDEPPELLHNESAAGSWLTVVCEVPGGTAIPVGTTVTVTAGGRTMSRDIAAGDSYASTHDPRLHFGLGKAETADEVRVRWPDGTRTALRNVRARQFLVVKKTG
jgi:hypothetical protein